MIFHTVCNSSSWVLKNDTAMLWITAVTSGSRQRSPDAGWGSQCHPELSGASHQPEGTSSPHWHGRVRLLQCHSISEL